MDIGNGRKNNPLLTTCQGSSDYKEKTISLKIRFTKIFGTGLNWGVE